MSSENIIGIIVIVAMSIASAIIAYKLGQRN